MIPYNTTVMSHLKVQNLSSHCHCMKINLLFTFSLFQVKTNPTTYVLPQSMELFCNTDITASKKFSSNKRNYYFKLLISVKCNNRGIHCYRYLARVKCKCCALFRIPLANKWTMTNVLKTPIEIEGETLTNIQVGFSQRRWKLR